MVSRLQDPKVEVASLATATLSGIIKALPPGDIDALRERLMAQVARLFGAQHPAAAARKQRRSQQPAGMGGGTGRGLPVVAATAAAAAAGAPDGTSQQQQQQQGGASSLAEAQAVVQGLKAFVLSSPYDVPPWMPEVLVALVAAANNRNPLVRRDASKALSEFKRTHEEDATEQLKQMLGEEQWEALTQVTSSASYFV